MLGLISMVILELNWRHKGIFRKQNKDKSSNRIISFSRSVPKDLLIPPLSRSVSFTFLSNFFSVFVYSVFHLPPILSFPAPLPPKTSSFKIGPFHLSPASSPSSHVNPPLFFFDLFYLLTFFSFFFALFISISCSSLLLLSLLPFLSKILLFQDRSLSPFTCLAAISCCQSESPASLPPNCSV